MAPQKKNENGPVTAHFTSRVTTSVSVDNFRKRMERLSIMGEEELQNSSEIVSFQSKVIPLSLPEATNVGDVVYPQTAYTSLQLGLSFRDKWVGTGVLDSSICIIIYVTLRTFFRETLMFGRKMRVMRSSSRLPPVHLSFIVNCQLLAHVNSAKDWSLGLHTASTISYQSCLIVSVTQTV